MRFYSTTHEEYVRAVQKFNLHPELENLCPQQSQSPNTIQNMIVYGPAGVGKYSQVLYYLSKHSHRKLASIKRLRAQFNRQIYQYQISDIHYEIDMGLLGCNSKLLWHEIFTQILDIVYVKADKIGVIVCKNFHLIHAELLEIFYSYMEHYSSQIRFIFITENVSFIPNKIYNRCRIIRVARPSQEKYEKLLELENITMRGFSPAEITNIKEYISFAATMERGFNEETNEIMPITAAKKSFVIICDEIIRQMKDYKKMVFTGFRDAIYDIFIYNLDVADCIWYILIYFIRELENINTPKNDISSILLKTYTFFKYYNNNYRPIYHLESLFIHVIRIYASTKKWDAVEKNGMRFSKKELPLPAVAPVATPTPPKAAQELDLDSILSIVSANTSIRKRKTKTATPAK